MPLFTFPFCTFPCYTCLCYTFPCYTCPCYAYAHTYIKCPFYLLPWNVALFCLLHIPENSISEIIFKAKYVQVQILPSCWSVRQKMAIATLCTLWFVLRTSSEIIVASVHMYSLCTKIDLCVQYISQLSAVRVAYCFSNVFFWFFCDCDRVFCNTCTCYF